MEIFPAIDIKGGQAVRLTQGDYDSVTVYGREPAEVAARFLSQGARNLHVVDLDGARDGSPFNFEKIRGIVALGGLFVQVGGGIRDEARIRDYLDLGAGRVILGTVAAENFDFTQRMAEKYKERIAVSVDARDGKVSLRGWRQDSNLDALEFCKKLEGAGVMTIIYTDISRDGMLGGANLDAYRALADAVRCDVIASGGVSGMGDIAALRDIGVHGVIVGKALYEGTLSLSGLVAAC